MQTGFPSDKDVTSFIFLLIRQNQFELWNVGLFNYHVQCKEISDVFFTTFKNVYFNFL